MIGNIPKVCPQHTKDASMEKETAVHSVNRSLRLFLNNPQEQEKTMGAWGSEAFENDDGSDWVYDLEETDSLDLIIESLTYILDNRGEYLDRLECTRAVAAAETLA